MRSLQLSGAQIAMFEVCRFPRRAHHWRTLARTRSSSKRTQRHRQGGEIRFDYRVKLRPVTRSNALALMRAVGLELEPELYAFVAGLRAAKESRC